MTRTLDLGCGICPRNPFKADEIFGVDVRKDLMPNVKQADLVVEPIPYEDGFFDYVTAFDFLEHIPRVIYTPSRKAPFIDLMNEIWRVMRVGGIFLSHTPVYPSPLVFQDPTHVNIMTHDTLSTYFCHPKRWASMYGFDGFFFVMKELVVNDTHLLAMLIKGQHPRRLGAK